MQNSKKSEKNIVTMGFKNIPGVTISTGIRDNESRIGAFKRLSDRVTRQANKSGERK